MNEPKTADQKLKRFDPPPGDHTGMDEHPEGGFVHFEDYDELLAEVVWLRAVAVAAKALVNEPTGRYYYEDDLCAFPEPLVTALETALAAAGYDMTDEEFEAAL
jgi:hypothetical protein